MKIDILYPKAITLDILSKIIHIQKRNNSLIHLIKSKITLSETGFLSKVCNESELILKENILLAFEKKDSQPVGYLFLQSGHNFHSIYQNTKLIWNSYSGYIDWKTLYISGRFLYIEQIGILPERQNMGIGRMLIKKLFETWKGHLFIAAVISQPVLNAKSHRFFNHLSFKNVGKFITKSFNGIPNLKSSAFFYDA